jgi:hypothetical protein
LSRVASDHNSPTYTSCIAETTGVRHSTWFSGWRGGSAPRDFVQSNLELQSSQSPPLGSWITGLSYNAWPTRASWVLVFHGMGVSWAVFQTPLKGEGRGAIGCFLGHKEPSSTAVFWVRVLVTLAAFVSEKHSRHFAVQVCASVCLSAVPLPSDPADIIVQCKGMQSARTS